MNEHYIKNINENELFNQLTKYCEIYQEKIPNEKGDKIKSSLPFLKNKAKTLEDIYKNSKYIIQDKVTFTQDDLKLIDNKAKKILLEKAEVNVINGTARFTRPNRVAVESKDGDLEHLEFRDAIVATGSSPESLPNLLSNGQKIVDTEALLFQDNVPEQLTLVGGGYIGVELATVYAKLGSRVVIVESEEQLLPGFNKHLSKKLETGLRSLGVGICLGYKAVSHNENELIIENDQESSSIPSIAIMSCRDL